MKDGLGNELTLGQTVAIPCNSRFKIGVLYKYAPNRNKHYLAMVRYVNGEDAEDGYPDGEYINDWRANYYTQERVDKEANIFYVRFPDGKTRRLFESASILAVTPPETEDVEEN